MQSFFRVAMVSLVVSMLTGMSTARAQQRPMTLVDFLTVPRITDPQLSPDGRQIIYVRQDANWSENRRIGHVWLINVDGSGQVQMTSGNGEQSPRWSPDSKTIAFVATHAEDEVDQIYLLPNTGGEAYPLTSHPTLVSRIAWAPNGQAIYFLAPDEKTLEQKAKDEYKDDVQAFDESYQQQHLWKLDIGSGAADRVTSGDYSVLNYRLSRDGTRMAFHRAPSPLFGEAELGEVWIADASGSNTVRLTTNAVPEHNAALSPDNSQVLFTADSNDRFQFYYNANLFIVPATGGDARLLTADFPFEITAAAWSSNGASVWIVANMGVHSELFTIDVATGTSTQITDGDHAVQGWHYVASANRHVVQLDAPTRAGDLWIMDARTDAEPIRVTDVFGYLRRDFRIPRQEKIQWPGADGVTIEGLVFYPLDYEPGTHYPLCVQTHGGPAASDKFGFQRWRDYVTVLTAMGYVVFKPNYRGSTGYGDAFLRDMVGSYFHQSHLDVMTGIDHLIERGLVDPDRMVKMGWSGGGHMTNKIITFTDRFKAASSGAGAANWVSMYAQSDVRTYRTPWFGGTPWQVDAPIDVYWKHSPLKDVANVTTPTLFLVGEDDLRVPMLQSVEMYRALKSLGVPTHLYVAPREGHVWQELRHELFKMKVELDWFETHATGRSYEWETPPGEESAGAAGKPSTP